MENKFFVYAHKNLSGDVFYIGKGSGKRAQSKNGRSESWKIASLQGYTCHMISQNLTEDRAFLLERRLIEKYRPQLCNITSGGQGISGMVHSDETKRKISEKNSFARKGVKLSEEHKKRISEGSKGKKKSPAMVAKLKASKNTPEQKAKARATAIKNSQDPVISAKKAASLSRIRKGVKLTDSTKKLISASQGGRPVLCIDTGTVFDFASLALNWIRFTKNNLATQGNITKALQGKLKTAYGYRWAYAD